MSDQKLIEIILDLKKWYENRVANCQLIIDNDDADICLDMGDSEKLEFGAKTKEARFIRIGIMLALQQFRPFPISITQPEDAEMEEEDDE